MTTRDTSIIPETHDQPGGKRLKPVTLSEVAKEAGVSLMTVSRALRGVGRVHATTRQKVRDTAERLGYMADAGVLGRPQHRGSTEPGLRLLIGQPPPPENGDYGSELIRGILDRLNSRGGTLEYCVPESLEAILAAWDQHSSDGLILRTPLPHAWVDALCRRGPVVQGASHDFLPGVDAIYTNELRSADMVFRHLASFGHRRILWLGLHDLHAPGDLIPQWGDENDLAAHSMTNVHGPRHAAWAYMTVSNAASQRYVILDRDWRRDSLDSVLAREVPAVLAQGDPPTAIVVSTDVMGVAVLNVLNGLGIAVPEQMSVVSYGGTSLAQSAVPRLTAIQLPMYMVGRALPELVERRLADPNAVPATIQLEARLVPGDSVARPLSQPTNGA